MGLFDELYFESSPFKTEEIVYFQTKSLDNLLTKYRITIDNLLQKRNDNTNQWENINLTCTIKAYEYIDNYEYLLDIIVIKGKVDSIKKKKNIILEGDK